MIKHTHSLFSHQKKLLVLLLLINCLILSVSLLWIFHRVNNPHEIITLTKDGFIPRTLTIRPGTTVLFKTTLTDDFWPASDPHPTHNIFPAFDPRHPLKPTESWSFTFTKIGTWSFHDHLHPQNKGIIIVSTVSSSAKSPAISTLIACESQLDKNTCFENTLQTLLKKNGVVNTLTAAAAMTRTDPQFLNNCHDLMHMVGQNAFDIYKDQNKFETSQDASMCGYGFYHGFMEKLLSTSQDYTLAKVYCDKITQTQPLLISNACFHGVGHGIVEYLVGKYPKDLSQLTSHAIDMCTAIVGKDNSTKCLSGVFMEISNDLAADTYTFHYDKTKPLSLCNTLSPSIRKECYNQFYGILLASSGNNVEKAIAQLLTIPNPQDRIYPIQNLVSTATQIESSETTITLCHTLKNSDKTACLEGIALAYLLKSESGSEYKNTQAFCENSSLTRQEQEDCTKFTFQYMKNSLSHNDFTIFCNQVPPSQKKYCTRENTQSSVPFVQ